MGYIAPTSKNQSDLITESIWNADVVDNVVELAIRTINIPLDGNTYVLSTGIAARIFISQDMIIQQVTLGADQTGSVVLDFWVDTHGNYPPTNADTIAAAALPTLDSEIKYQDGTLTGWTKSITGGSWLFINIDSVATITFLTVAIKVSLE